MINRELVRGTGKLFIFLSPGTSGSLDLFFFSVSLFLYLTLALSLFTTPNKRNIVTQDVVIYDET